jgi:hypothetical protein
MPSLSVLSKSSAKFFKIFVLFQAYEVKGRTLLKEAEVCLMNPKKPYKVSTVGCIE